RGGRGGRLGTGRAGGRSSPRQARISQAAVTSDQDMWQHDHFQGADFPPVTPSAQHRRTGKPAQQQQQRRQQMAPFEQPLSPVQEQDGGEAFTPGSQQFTPPWQRTSPEMRTPGGA